MTADSQQQEQEQEQEQEEEEDVCPVCIEPLQKMSSKFVHVRFT